MATAARTRRCALVHQVADGCVVTYEIEVALPARSVYSDRAVTPPDEPEIVGITADRLEIDGRDIYMTPAEAQTYAELLWARLDESRVWDSVCEAIEAARWD